MSRKPLNQKGFTLMELLVAIGIASFLIVGVTAAILQLISVSDRNSNYMTAYTEVQNAGFSVSRDAVQALVVSDADDPGTPEIEFLTLDWRDFEDNAHEVVYTLKDASDGLKELWRDYSYSDNGIPKEETLLVAKYIDPATSCRWGDDPATPEIEPENVLTLEVTAEVGGKTATRTYNIEPRPLS